jgi:serine/threonine protein kinase
MVPPRFVGAQVVALPPVDMVVSGQVRATEIPPTNEKVDIWALGVTIFELVTGMQASMHGSRRQAGTREIHCHLRLVDFYFQGASRLQCA